jgi:hypothetical protein
VCVRRRSQAPPPPYVALSSITAGDSAAGLHLSPDQMTVTGDKGFKTARATHGASEGAWYYEALILEPLRPDGHVRLGWSTTQGELQVGTGTDIIVPCQAVQ